MLEGNHGLSVVDNRRVLRLGKPLKMSESALRREVKTRLRLVNRALMRLHTMNYTQLAETLGVGSSAIHNWESPSKLSLPGPYRLYIYTSQYGVSLDWLFKGDPSGLPWRLAQSIQEVEAYRSSQPAGEPN